MRVPIIINEAGRIHIDSVPRLAWGKGRECTFIGALEAAFAVTPTPFTYENLMGWSGLALRVRWFQGEAPRRWCPSSPVGEFADEIMALRRATGYELPGEVRLDRPVPHMEDFAPRIAAEIRAGRPMLAYEPQLNVAVIFGIEDHGNIVLLRDYMSDEAMVRLPVEKLGGFICFLGRNGAALTPRDALVEGLRVGVENWHCGPRTNGEGRYWYGRAAIAKWRDDILRADELSSEDRRLLFFVNWWVFDCLADARVAAEKYLRRNEEYFYGSTHRHLLDAATVLGDEARLLRGAIADKQAFLGPWTGKNIEHWSGAVREREAALLARVLELESTAIGELENLLAAADVPVRESIEAGVH